MLEGGGGTFGRRPRWLGRIVSGVLDVYHRPPRDRPKELAQVIDALLAERRVRTIPPVARWFTFEPEMGRMRWHVPALRTLPELADFLELDIGHLQWLADARGWERHVPDEQLRNYRYTFHPRERSVVRVIERPKSELKRVQRVVLRRILDAFLRTTLHTDFAAAGLSSRTLPVTAAGVPSFNPRRGARLRRDFERIDWAA